MSFTKRRLIKVNYPIKNKKSMTFNVTKKKKKETKKTKKSKKTKKTTYL